MAELHPELAKAKANTALQFLASFDNEDFGFLREDTPGPHDRRNLAMALDYIQELGAMVLNLADRVTPNAALRGAEPASSAERPLEGTVMPHNGTESRHG